MSKKYNCKICNLETDKLSNYERHLKSKKHLTKIGVADRVAKGSHQVATVATQKNKINKIWSCKYCNKIFKHKSSKYKHEKKCVKLDLKIEYKKLKQELEETKQKLTSLFNSVDLVSF